MNIICRKTNCKHNKNFICYYKNVKIEEHSLCLSYEKSDKENIDTSKTMLKKTPKYNPYRSVKKLNIQCNANCQFCKNCNCVANGITVNDLDAKPYCVTYFKRVKK